MRCGHRADTRCPSAWQVNLIDFGCCRKVGTAWGTLFRARSDGRAPFFGYWQHPPELWAPSITLTRTGGDTTSGKGDPTQVRPVTKPWDELRVSRNHDIWAAGTVYYTLLWCATLEERVAPSSPTEWPRKLPSAKQLTEQMVGRIESGGGDTESARQVLERATARLPPTPRSLLLAMLEPDPSLRACAATARALALRTSQLRRLSNPCAGAAPSGLCTSRPPPDPLTPALPSLSERRSSAHKLLKQLEGELKRQPPGDEAA